MFENLGSQKVVPKVMTLQDFQYLEKYMPFVCPSDCPVFFFKIVYCSGYWLAVCVLCFVEPLFKTWGLRGCLTRCQSATRGPSFWVSSVAKVCLPIEHTDRGCKFTRLDLDGRFHLTGISNDSRTFHQRVRLRQSTSSCPPRGK